MFNTFPTAKIIIDHHNIQNCNTCNPLLTRTFHVYFSYLEMLTDNGGENFSAMRKRSTETFKYSAYIVDNYMHKINHEMNNKQIKTN